MAANDRFRTARRRQQLVQVELAIKAGTAVGMISMIEKHGYRPGSDVRARLARALNVSATELWPPSEKSRA